MIASLGDQIAAKAIEWAAAKVKYQHRGYTRNGCDCTGLIIGILQELGYVKGYVARKYSTDWNLHGGASDYISVELLKYGRLILNSEAAPGDVALMRYGRCISHVGIIVNRNLLFVHCFVNGGYCKYGILRNSSYTPRWEKTVRFNSL